jgi:hypothetical protein
MFNDTKLYFNLDMEETSYSETLASIYRTIGAYIEPVAVAVTIFTRVCD